MNTDNVLFKYWNYSLPRIKELNPNLFDSNNPTDRNAMNGYEDCGIEFNCLANKKRSNIPAKSIAVELYIDGKPEEQDRIKKQFDILESKRSDIETKIPNILWNRNPGKRASSIICYEQLDFTDERNWKECADFHATMMRKLYQLLFLPCRDELAILFREATSQNPNHSKKMEWFITCDFDEYDIFSAFNELPRIEWGQPNKLKRAIAGDTVFIYVTGKIGAVCFKTRIDKEGLFGIGTIDDLRFQKKRYEPVERRYMILELEEAYPTDKFTLKKLQERGLKDYYPKELSAELSCFLNGASDSHADKKAPLMLSSLLRKYGLDPETTKLARHSYNDAKECIEKGFIEAYQSIQKNNVFHGRTHLLSFIGEPKGTAAVFLGLYEVRGEYIGNHQSRMPEGFPQPEAFQNDRYFYDLAKLDEMVSLEGKLKIEWGNSAKRWNQNATTDKVILECPEYNASTVKQKVVFCNVAYMKYYDSDIAEPSPKNGGSFVRDNGFGFERNNFHAYQDPDGIFCKGFVETGHSGELSSVTTSHQLVISRIDPKEEIDEKVEGVTVVFCATKPNLGCVIVGWYRNATVFKCVQEDNAGNLYSFVADSSDCVLLNEKKRVFKVPRSGRDGSDFGFGRFNVWYADEASSHEYVASVMRYIVQSSEEPVDDPEEVILSTEEAPEFIESGNSKKTIVNSYERNQKARRECLRIRGTDCIVCGFNSAKVYGPDFEKKIEVHHIIPISERGGEYKVNPETDLIPVCPNCHSILHTKNKDGKTLTWEELRARIKGETD